MGNLVGHTTVRVVDANGLPVPGVKVDFRLPGPGTLIRTAAVSDQRGYASAGGWRLGPEPGLQRLVAESGGLSSTLAMDARESPASEFKIQIRLLDSNRVSMENRRAVEAAVQRWEPMILGDLQTVTLGGGVSSGCPSIPDLRGLQVDDILLLVWFGTIDGAAAATNLCVRRPGTGLPVVAFIRIDEKKANALDGVEAEMAHEIGHALGIGTIWESLLVDWNGDVRFAGPNAAAAYRFAGGGSDRLADVGVPVQLIGGAAVAGAHWRETELKAELLTPFVDPGVQPLSAITIAALRDLGYLVDDRRAEPFVVP
jgi:hypothetical protein